MANEQNLRPIKLTHEEATELGRLGGIASGEAKRARRRLREYMEAVLDLPISDKRKFNKLAKAGVKFELMDNEMLMAMALFDKAVTGDVAAFKEIRSVIGEDVLQPPTGSEESDNLFDVVAKAVLNR